MNLIILGPPGSGKGTQAKLLADHFHLTHISSGELLRLAVKSDQKKGPQIKKYLDSGQLVPFDTVLDVITDKIKSSPGGFVLDGTPRDLSQAEHMDWFFKKHDIVINYIIYLDLSDEESIKRLLSRAQKENRSDDTKEVIQKRLQIYHQDTSPVIDYYQKNANLITVDGSPDISTVTDLILKQLPSS